MLKAVDIVAAKQTFKAPIAIEAGDKEVMKHPCLHAGFHDADPG